MAPSGRGRYATDSLRTQLLREIAPHFEHRLFLTATPHNGYSESFSALLALLDDQRFVRGVEPDAVQLRTVMVRRLKDEPEIREWDGKRRFPERQVVPLQVDYTPDERALHVDLQRYSELLLDRSRAAGQGFAAEFVLKLLKKRLFSSPQAFHDTLEEHARTMNSKEKEAAADASARALARRVGDLDEEFADDEHHEESTAEATRQASRMLPAPSKEERALLRSLRERAEQALGRPDARAARLLRWLQDTLKPGGRWNETRVIIFTEYRSTQRWLAELLATEGFAGEERLELLYGGMETKRREAVKAAFQASPEVAKVRILLATDAASEGIDLQNHCHQLLHNEIPWNPMRLEQRNGRVDRRGQQAEAVLIHHFVPKGYESGREDPQVPVGQLEGDLEFLARAVEKVERIRYDLGKVGPVIADQVSEAMLGVRRQLDTRTAESDGKRIRGKLTFERKLAEDLRRLAGQLHETRQGMHLDPANIHHVVATGLEVAERPPLEPVKVRRKDRDGHSHTIDAWHLPPLEGSWAACHEGLAHPHTHVIRPIVFDPALADGHDDVVLAHLHHRLVAMCLRLLRGEVWSSTGRRLLHRVTARIAPDTALRHPVVVAHGRIVVLGGDHRRVHEQIIAAGGSLEEGRFARLNVGQVDAALAAATVDMPAERVSKRFVERWADIHESLDRALEARMKAVSEGLAKRLGERAEKEADDITSTLEELARGIRKELEAEPPEQLDLWQESERQQRNRDREELRQRLERIPTEIAEERALIAKRYAECKPRLFPVAVTFIVPARLAR